MNGFWKEFWKLTISHKIKLFAWCACKDDLPCLSNLKKRKANANEQCPFCTYLEKDLAHALFYYPSIQEWWPKYLPYLEELEQPLNFLDLIL